MVVLYGIGVIRKKRREQFKGIQLRKDSFIKSKYHTAIGVGMAVFFCLPVGRGEAVVPMTVVALD